MTKEVAVHASTKPSQQSRTIVGDVEAAPRDWAAVEQWITGVLSRARQAAEATDGPQSVRGILYLAHCFADELATANPRFDRLSFITAVTEGPS
jgi:hypothetical protein